MGILCQALIKGNEQRSQNKLKSFKGIDFGDSYLLALADGQRWELITSNKDSKLFSQLVSILQLKKWPSGSNPKIVFTERITAIERDSLRTDGWQSQKLGNWFIVWAKEEATDYLFELIEETAPSVEICLAITALFPIYLKAIAKGGFPVHAGLIVKEGYGFILPARGGTGKSTCCARVPAPWQSPADDESLIVRVSDNDYQVHPFPTWSNFFEGREKRSWEVGKSYQLKAILFLEQSKEDRLTPLRPGAASARVYQSAEQSLNRCLVGLSDQKRAEMKRKLFANSCAIAKHIPAYILECSLTGRFWECLEEIIDKSSTMPV